MAAWSLLQFSYENVGDIMISETTDAEKLSWVKNELLSKIVRGCIVGDLRRMLNIEVVPNYYGNCNFPIALYTLTSMDFLGYLIAKQEFSPHGNTGGRIRAYIEMVFDSEDRRKLEPYRKHFVAKFRHGLAHEFFPKKAGISRGNSEIMTWSKEDECWVLDADRLAEMFLGSVANLEKLVDDVKVGVRISDRYEKMQLEIAEYKRRPDISDIPTETISLSTAGATTTTLPFKQARRVELEQSS